MNDLDMHLEETEAMAVPAPERNRLPVETLKHAADTAVEALIGKKAEDVESIDVAGKTTLADCFIVASGTSGAHIKTLAETVEEKLLAEYGIRPDRIEGLDSLNWILLDYSDFVIHIMLKEQREFYNLENLWSDFGRSRRNIG